MAAVNPISKSSKTIVLMQSAVFTAPDGTTRRLGDSRTVGWATGRKRDGRHEVKLLLSDGRGHAPIEWRAWLKPSEFKFARLAESQENPISKTTETLITIGAIAGGIGLLVWMIKEMAPKKKTEAAPPGGVLPVSTNEPTYRVFQRYIDGLDTQGMKCTAPQLVFEGPRSRANDLAWRITTREPVGGRGLVAVAVPVDFFVTSECNWRRLCMADGSCMGVIGLQG